MLSTTKKLLVILSVLITHTLLHIVSLCDIQAKDERH